MEENMIKGSIVALVTPFKNGEIDFEAIDKLVKMQIDGGTDGILINSPRSDKYRGKLFLK